MTQQDPDFDAKNDGYQSDSGNHPKVNEDMDQNDLLARTSNHQASLQQSTIREATLDRVSLY